MAIHFGSTDFAKKSQKSHLNGVFFVKVGSDKFVSWSIAQNKHNRSVLPNKQENDFTKQFLKLVTKVYGLLYAIQRYA